MAIVVTCPQCGTQFSVHDRFAGRKGPCPKCSATIPIPELAGTADTGVKAAPSKTTPGKTAAPSPPAKPAPGRTSGGSGGGAPSTSASPATAAASKASGGASLLKAAPPPLPSRSGSSSPAAKTGGAAPAKPGTSTAAGAAATAAKQQPVIRDDEIKIHGPEEYASGGKDSKGRGIGKPIGRVDAKFKIINAILVVAAALAVLATAWYLGRSLTGSSLQTAVGGLIFAISIPLAIAGYWILCDPELEPYGGLSLWVRATICGSVYSLLWLLRGMIPVDWTADPWNWAMIAPPFFIAGAITPYLTLDLEAENTGFHFALFFLISVLLRGAAGLSWV